MCGIVGYVGQKAASPLLLECLRRLEYRGYDSAGIAVVPGGGDIRVTRAQGKLVNLEKRIDHDDKTSVGIGHTRWATHGRPSEANAHPHRSEDGAVVCVHNGIFENYLELRQELAQGGWKPTSETDTECFPALVSNLMGRGASFDDAFRGAVSQLRGIYAIACLHKSDPERVLAARSGPPLVIGLGDGENFLASDVTALLSHTRDVIYLEDGDFAEITRDEVKISDADGKRVERTPTRIDWDSSDVELGQYRHYMQKEIFEQPQAIASTLVEYVRGGDHIDLGLPFSDEELRSLERLVIVACGTSWHAGHIGKFMFEQIAGISCDVDYASEYRYRSPVLATKSLAIAITQSGETADTLAALQEAARRGARTLTVCNVMGSTATRNAEATILTKAGPEIGVASTKAFTTQLTALMLLALELGRVRGTITSDQRKEVLDALRVLPAQVEKLHSLEPKLESLAARWKDAPSALFLGRGLLYPVALEGALKLKEISYIHAEGYPAGEMKHGPIALIDDNMPVIALMPDDENRDRTLSNLQEAAARDGQLIGLVTEGDTGLDDIATEVISLPRVHRWVAPILYTIPLQLFSYHSALLRGCDVDQPRNLAKSVTVE